MGVSMKDVRNWLTEHTLLQTMKRIGAKFYGGEAVFTDDASTLEDCLQRSRELHQGEPSLYAGRYLEQIKDLYEHIQAYEELEQWLEDDRSKEVLANLLMYRLTFRDSCLLRAYCPGDRRYFVEDFMLYEPDGVWVDCGASEGAATLEYIAHVPGFGRCYVYEPEEAAYKACVRNLSALSSDRIEIHQCAVAEADASASATSLDSHISERISMIKMDVRGHEQDAIRGAKRHISEDRPVLAVSVCYQPDDLRVIPGMIRALNGDYRFMLRHHRMNADDTVLYAIPKQTGPDASASRNHEAPKGLAPLLTEEFIREREAAADFVRALADRCERNEDAVKDYQRWLTDQQEAHQYFEQQYNGAKEAREYFEKQYTGEKEAREYFEKQYAGEKEAREYFEKQYTGEKEAREYFEKQLTGEKEAREYFEQQLTGEKEAREYFEKQYAGEKESREYFEKQYAGEKESREYFEQQLAGEKEAREYFEQQLAGEKEAREYFEKQYTGEKEAREYFEKQYAGEKEAREYFEQQLTGEKEAREYFEKQLAGEKEAREYFQRHYEQLSQEYDYEYPEEDA